MNGCGRSYLRFGWLLTMQALCGIGFGPVVATAGSWQSGPSLLTARDQFAGGVIDGKLIVFGGNGNPIGVNLKSTELLDSASGSWVYRAYNNNNGGYGVEELSGAVVNGKFYVFGASGGLNFVEEYDPSSDAWTSKAPMPTARASATAVAYNNKIYLFGGYYEDDYSARTNYAEVIVYDPASNTWTNETRLPKLLSSPAIAVVGDNAYVIGGYTGDPGAGTFKFANDVLVYNFLTRTWRVTGQSPLPNPRVFSYSSAAPVKNGRIYLIGGIEATTISNAKLSSKIDIYDTVANTWAVGETLPRGNNGQYCAIVDNDLWMVGGESTFSADGDNIVTNAVWKHSLSSLIVDNTRPAVAITTPTDKQRILGTNAWFTIKGTASDKVGVTNVQVQVNGSWQLAVTTNAWKNWCLPVTLIPGTNTICAYSVDAAGNNSLISTVKCVYAETGTLIIQTNGVGTVTRAPTGAPEVNKTYTLTAAAGAGSVFLNWTGAVNNPTNKVTTFMMTSNMTIRANFTDIAKPTVAITAPTALQRIVTNGLIAVRGTATDNKAVSNVLVQVNGGGWTNASTTNGWKNWNAEVTVSARTNTVRAYSMDTTGNCSTTSSVTFVYVEMGNLTIQTNGQGSVTRAPATTPELGVKYTMTATPKAGSVFTNWTYGIGGHVATNKPAITFTMPSNLVLTANFTDIAKPTVTITLPTANLRITNTNPVYTVKGTATDNGAVATVKVRLNSGDWTNAVTTNAWKNWSVPVTLVTGTNTVRAYSIDTTGNNSSTTTVACIYPVVTIDVAAYANLSVGGRWNYKKTRGTNISTSADQILRTTIENGQSVYFLQSYNRGNPDDPDDQEFLSTDLSQGLFQVGGLNDYGLPTQEVWYFQPNMPKLMKRFVPGAEYAINFTRSGGYAGIFKESTVRETVKVPSGTYDCWKVTRIITTTRGVVVNTLIRWYAEDIGLVKNHEFEPGTVGSIWELTSYVPPASSDPMGIPSSGQEVAPALTPHAAITVDGSSKDWTDIPRSSFSYSSVTQEVAVALDGNNIALLLSGCPFNTSDTVLVYFKLRLTYGEGDNRHTVDLWTSGSVLYGMVDGQVITGLEAVLLNGVLEVKIPVEQAPSQVTIEEVGCGVDLGGGMMKELFRITAP